MCIYIYVYTVIQLEHIVNVLKTITGITRTNTLYTNYFHILLLRYVRQGTLINYSFTTYIIKVGINMQKSMKYLI